MKTLMAILFTGVVTYLLYPLNPGAVGLVFFMGLGISFVLERSARSVWLWKTKHHS